MVWWSWKNWLLTVNTLGGCGGLERTDFAQFLLWECVVFLQELIFNSFYIQKVWWSHKNRFFSFTFGRLWWSGQNWFFTISMLRGCDGFKRTDFKFPLWESLVVLKDLIFLQFLLWEGVVVLTELLFSQFPLWEGVVVLKELILNSFHFGRVWWFWKTWLFAVSTLGGCGGLEITDF